MARFACSYTSDPQAISCYRPLTDSSRGQAFVFERLRSLKDDMLVVKVKGVETREEASALTGVELFARRDQLPEASEDEFTATIWLGFSRRPAMAAGSVMSPPL